jgi:alginate O-acetyltransferase complex protein AlgI
MSTTSWSFAALVIIALLVYNQLPRRAQNYWLLVISYVFCASWAWQFAVVMFVVTIVNFYLGRWLHRYPQRGRLILWLGVLGNLAVLAVFRMADFFVPQLIALFQVQASPALEILVPIGLSYYILENISYLIDIRAGQVEPAGDPVDFALYIAYFPKLIAGPIERARDFLPRLAAPRQVEDNHFIRGLSLIMLGMVRKLLVADTLAAAMRWEIFETPQHFGAPELLIWLVVFSFYLYSDFAGYTDMVRGVSSLFGIELSRNFDNPYFARNFVEFWNRWHMTLSHWLRDYIYYPITRALLRRQYGRSHPASLVIPPMITMLASGLWHGFSGHMLLWGALHGMYQVIERILLVRRPANVHRRQPVWRSVASAVLVFTLVAIAWVPFRTGLSNTLMFWQRLLVWNDWNLQYQRILLVLPLLVVVILLDFVTWFRKDELIFLKWPRPVRAFLLAASVFLIMFVLQGETLTPFVYQGF